MTAAGSNASAPALLAARLRAWWRRSVRVERAEGYDVVVVEVTDPASGRNDRIHLSRNNFFAMAWVLARSAEHGMTHLHLTMRIPIRGGEVEVTELDVPEWARRKLTSDALRLAQAMGWRGECPQPAKVGPYR